MNEDHRLDHLKNWFTQFVANNLEHNIDTLDIKVFYGTDIIIVCSILNKDIPE